MRRLVVIGAALFMFQAASATRGEADSAKPKYYQIDLKVVDVGKDGTEKAVANPALRTADKMKNCFVIGGEAPVRTPNGGVMFVEFGHSVQVRVSSCANNKVHADVRIEKTEVSEASEDRVVTCGKCSRYQGTAELTKPMKFVCGKPEAGTPRTWVEFTVKEISQEEFTGTHKP